MRTWLSLCLALATLAAPACAPRVRVTTHVVPGTDFSTYRTFAVVPPPDSSEAVRGVLERQIALQLDGHGYLAAPKGSSDLLVVVQEKALPAQRQIFAESPGGCCQIQNYVANTLVLEVFDARRGVGIWRGTGEVDLQSVSEQDLESTARRTVAAILAEFPHRDTTP